MSKRKSRFVFRVVLIYGAMLATWRQDSQAYDRKTTAEPGWSELMGGAARMHAGIASVEPSGDSDVDFVRLMLPHHQAAIDMAKTQLTYGKDPQMRRLAQEIIADQQSEIDLMRLWLRQHAPKSARTD